MVVEIDRSVSRDANYKCIKQKLLDGQQGDGYRSKWHWCIHEKGNNRYCSTISLFSWGARQACCVYSSASFSLQCTLFPCCGFSCWVGACTVYKSISSSATTFDATLDMATTARFARMDVTCLIRYYHCSRSKHSSVKWTAAEWRLRYEYDVYVQGLCVCLKVALQGC